MALIEQMSRGLAMPPAYLRAWSAKARHAYKEYTIRKRTGGLRTIHHPAKPLKALQRWLLRNVIVHWPVHEAATAYREGLGIKANARRHAANGFLLRMDLEDFFPSLATDDIITYLESKPEATVDGNERDRRFFVAIVCRGDRLTIGAPTSPALSNALLYLLDCRISEVVGNREVVYTRYADDLFFSTSRPNVLREIERDVRKLVSESVLPAGLQINETKTRHLSRKHKRTVTGLVLGSRGEVTIGRKRKRMIRTMIYQLDGLSPEERSYLRGLLAFARDVEPDFINSLVIKYGRHRVFEAAGIKARVPSA